MSLRALVVDDAVFFRRVLSDALGAIPGVEVAGSAANGRLALQKIKELRPDFVTLDLEMPEMNGLSFLDELRRSGERTEVVVISAVSKRGSELTLKALSAGAFDFITKPDASTPEKNREALIKELTPLVRAVATRNEVRSLLRNGNGANKASAPSVTPRPIAPSLDNVAGRMQQLSANVKPEMVVIGVSTGGPVALGKMLPSIPKDLGVPIFIVQHMPAVFTQALADELNSRCAVRVREATHNEVPQPNVAYIAPGGRQMRLSQGADGKPVIQITDDPPENNCRPAVDYLFRSVSTNFPGRAVAVILTGMGSDGTLGLKLLKRQGCFVIAQDEASCVVYGMPKAAVDAGVTDVVLPIESIAAQIAGSVKRGRA